MNPSITALYLIKNEEEFLPLSVATIIDHVDKVILVDNGSTDNTRPVMHVIKTGYPDKVHTFSDDNNFDRDCEYNVRNRWLSKVDTDWVMPLDADQMLSDGWHKWVRMPLQDSRYDAIRFLYEHWVGDCRHIHKTFYEKQKDQALHPDVPLYQDVLFRMRPDLKWSPAAWLDGRFKEFHHASPGPSMVGRRFFRSGSATCFHAGFIKRNMMDMSRYRIQRGDYGHEQDRKDQLIKELTESKNPFKFIGSVHRVDYGPERIPSVMRNQWNKYSLELDEEGFIQKRIENATGSPV